MSAGAEAAARIHARAVVPPDRPWTAREFARLADLPGGLLLLSPEADALLLGRIAGDEAEVLTLATTPEARRLGRAAALLARFEAAAREGGAAEAFLEVAADNAAARALYARAGWAEVGRRRGYYEGPDGARRDALVLRRALRGEAGVGAGARP